MDRALVSVEHFGDLAEYLPVARRYSLGLELQEFSDPAVLDDDWRGLLDQYQQTLDGFPGMLTMHGPYIDLVSGSPDMRLVALTRERYLTTWRSGEVGAKYIDFHANYLPLVDHPSYLPGWVERQVAFWTPMAEQAEKLAACAAAGEHVGTDPAIINRILDRIRRHT